MENSQTGRPKKFIKSEILRWQGETDGSFGERWSDVIGSNYFPFAHEVLDHGKNPTMVFGIYRMDQMSIGKIEMTGELSATGWRSSKMIRENNTRIFLVWLTIAGRYEGHQAGKDYVSDGIHVAITRSDQPFRMNVYPDDGGNHLSYQIVIPVARMYELFPDVDAFCGSAYGLSGPDYAWVRDTVSSLYENCDRMSDDLCSHLALSALNGLTVILRETALAAIGGQTIDRAVRHEKGREVFRLTKHFAADPDVTPARIAAQSSISTRQVHRIFQAAGTSFMRHVHDLRLDRAQRLLTDPEFAAVPIGEICFIVGFYSHSHFDRLFRNRFGCSPKTARTAAMSGRSDEQAPGVDNAVI